MARTKRLTRKTVAHSPFRGYLSRKRERVLGASFDCFMLRSVRPRGFDTVPSAATFFQSRNLGCTKRF